MSSETTWKVVAVGATFGAVLFAFATAGYLASLVYASSEIAWASVTFVLVLDAVLRRSIRVASWFWPEHCAPEWLKRNPPLFRFDRLRNKQTG